MSEQAVELGAAGGVPAKHPLLAQVTGWLADIIVGQEASTLLDRSTASGGGVDVGLTLGDVWAWGPPLIDVGRKCRATGGQVYQLPIRVTWAGGHLQVSSSGSLAPARRDWAARGMGWALAGDSAVATEPHQSSHAEAGVTPHPVLRRVPGDLQTSLAGLVEAGRLARWGFVMWLQPMVASALVKAHSAVRAEMGGAGRPSAPLVDQVKLEQLAGEMLFGCGTTPSAVDRLLVLCAEPATFVRVDPLRYVRTAIRRDAATAIRRAIGDPHVGRKVRAVARELGTTDVDTVVQEYRRRWPGDHLAADRAVQALWVGADPMASWLSVE